MLWAPLQPLAMPLTAAELLSILRERWGASYDLQLHRRAGRLYLQVMWAYLEQQSFPLSEEDYLLRLEQLVEQLYELNRELTKAEGQLLRLAIDSKIDREEFLESLEAARE